MSGRLSGGGRGLVLALVAAGCTSTAEGDASMEPGAGPGWITYHGADRELVIEVGPVDLPAGEGHHGIEQPEARLGALPVGGWLSGYDLELVDRAGQPVPRQLLHHANLMTPGRRELFSPIMQRIGAAGSETGAVTLPRLIGYRMERGDSLLVTSMFHNPTSQAYEGVRLRVRMRWVPEGTRFRPFSIEPFYVDATPPVGPHSFHLPPGRSEQSWEGVPIVSGRILALAGHLHDHAVELRFENVTRDEVVWTSSPELDEDGRVTRMPQSFFLHRFGVKLHAGETYRLTAVYDNPTDSVIPDGGMGALGGVLLPERRARWPGVDRSHADYAEDLRRTLAGEHGMDASADASPAAHHH